MTLAQAESFAKVKELISRMADFRDFMLTFTDADMEHLQGFMEYYKSFEDSRVKKPKIKPFCRSDE